MSGLVDVEIAESLMSSLRIRSPTAELPTTAALLGGFIAQEAIKLITRQYVPVDGVCVIDLISSSTGTIKV